MNAAKRKRDPHPLAGFSAKFFPFLQGGWRPVVLGCVLVGLFVGGACVAWYQWGDQITASEEYFVLPEQIEVTAAPKWVKADVTAEVVRDGGLTRLSLLDKQMTIKVAQAFSEHHWVEKVIRVSKHQPSRLVVELVYRRPVGMVEVVLQNQPGLLPVDASGVLLPPSDFSEDQAYEYLRISVPDTTPTGAVGTAWGDPRVAGAARIASLLQDSWKALGLHHILANRPDPSITPPSPLDAPTYELFTRRGTRILWGPAPAAGNAVETANALKKVSRLLAHAKTNNNSLDTGQPSAVIDLRPKEELRTAQHPAERPEH